MAKESRYDSVEAKSTGLLQTTLTMYSCRLQRIEIVVEHMQLQAIRLRRIWLEGRSQEQPGTTSVVSDLGFQLSKLFESHV